MDFLEWGPQIELGIPDIDEQHRFLVDLMNTLSRRLHKLENRTAPAEAAQGMLKYADLHFADEEEMMRRCGYPGLERHIREHAKFLDHARNMAEKCSEADQAECLELFNFLAHWILEHIMGTDRMYVSCVKKTDAAVDAGGEG